MVLLQKLLLYLLEVLRFLLRLKGKDWVRTRRELSGP